MISTQTKNMRVHLLSLTLTRLGDGLLDPKLVLAWLLTSLGASAGYIGLLVPVREAGALLPQLFTAAKLRIVPVRKWWWVIGSVVQGICVFGIALAAISLTGNTAGAVIVLLIAVFALARSICSVSYKDVLGKTVEKSKRGSISGAAASFAALGILAFGLVLSFELVERSVVVLFALFAASALWLAAAVVFSFLHEEPSSITFQQTESIFVTYWRYLREDKELQNFLWVRGLLSATAIAPPFLLLLATIGEGSLLSQLGILVIVSSFSTVVSGWIWGSLSDWSTRLVLAIAGVSGGFFLFVALVASTTTLYTTVWFLPTLLFFFLTSYEGVSTARTIHLVNLATEETRAAYTAISNTVIGVVLLATGMFGILAEFTSVGVVIAVLGAMSLTGGLLAFKLG